MSTVEKAQYAASELRRIANQRAIVQRIGHEIRDAQADAIADLAEVVLGLVALAALEGKHP